jgi:hypothetical protein
MEFLFPPWLKYFHIFIPLALILQLQPICCLLALDVHYALLLLEFGIFAERAIASSDVFVGWSGLRAPGNTKDACPAQCEKLCIRVVVVRGWM